MANANATVNIKALFDVSDVTSKVGQIQKSLSNIKMPDNLRQSVNKTFSGLEKDLLEYQNLINKKDITPKDSNAISKYVDSISADFIKLQNVMAKIKTEVGDSPELSKFLTIDPSVVAEIKRIDDAIKGLKTSLSDIESTGKKNISGLFDNFKTEGAKNAAEEIKEAFEEALNAKDIETAAEKYQKALNLINKAQIEQANYAKRNTTKNNIFSDSDPNLIDSDKLEKSGSNIAINIKTFQALYTQISDLYRQITENLGKDSDYKAQKIEVINNYLDQQKQKLSEESKEVDNLADKWKNYGQAEKEAAKEEAGLNKEVDQLKSRIQYFFGLNNAIQLVKNTIRSAINTVKELDAAMTETAVVTDFSVGDMWDQLPEYTKTANELGVTTLGAYETMTLFYQQGLKTNEVFEVGTETMKMARIAGLDYATATDYMTAALRGFNMEINETSAKHVNDVYSELAAITASDTEEISVAMTKTASLANNANMEFETTSAYLSQIIETTRESAETAGTALKTVIARFTELKKDPSLIEDVEGEAVDANKIETALKSIGVALRDEAGQFRDLDDVFLDINARWDSLSTNQQRYIATMAAGSRQQSRFIAMMSDYARTQELVSAAYNSEGASEKQFEKTQESLESKLNKLSNAWNEFTMGIANSDLIKVGVDALTELLNVLNKLTNVKGLGGILKLGLGASLFSGFKSLSNIGTDYLANLLTGNKSSFGEIAKTVVNKGIADKSKQVSAGKGILQAFGYPLKGTIQTGKGIISKIKNYEGPSEAAINFKKMSPAQKVANAADNFKLPQTEKGLKALAIKAGSAFQSVGLFAGEGTSALTAFAGTLGIAAGAAAALGVAIKLAYDASPEGQLKFVESYADAMSNAASSVKEQADSAKEALESYKESQKEIAKATTNSERQTAINNANSQVLSMIESNSEYAQLLQTDQNGQMSLSGVTTTGQTLEDLVDEAQQGVIDAQIANLLAQSALADKQADVYQTQAKTAELDSQLADTVSQAEEYKQESLKKSNLEQAKRIQSANLASSAFTQMLGDTFANAEVTESVANALGNAFDADEFNKQVKKESGVGQFLGKDFWTSEKKLREEYKSLYGVDADENSTKEELATAIAEATLMAEQQTKVDNFAQELKNDTTGVLQQSLDLINGTLEKTFADMSNEDVNAFVDNLMTGSEEAEAELEVLATYLGKTTDQTLDYLKAQAKLEKETQKQNRVDLYQRMADLNVKGNNAQGTSEYWQQLTSGLTENQISSYKAYADQITDLSEDSQAKILADLPQYIKESSQEVGELFSDLDFSNPVRALSTLKDTAEDSTSSISTLANEIIELESETGLFTKENLVQNFLLSDSYSNITEDVEELIEANSRLTTSDIEDLADSCSDLNSLLEDGEISAYALAEALTAVESGEAAFSGLTDRILESLSAVESLNSVADHMAQVIEDFDPGQDYGEGVETLSDWNESLTELVNNYELGNEQTRNYVKEIFGEDRYEELYGLTGDVQLSNEQIQQNLTAELSKLSQYLENDGQGFFLLASQVDSLKNNVKVLDDGNIDIDFTDTKTAVEELAKAMNVSTDAAEMFFMVFRSHSTDLDDEFKAKDFAKFAADLQAQTAENPDAYKIGQNMFMSQAEWDVIKSIYDDAVPEIVDNIAKIGDTEYKILNWSGEDGELGGKEFIASVEEQLGDLQDAIYKEDNITIDIDKLIDVKQKAGWTDSQYADYVDYLESNIEKTGGKFEQTINVPVQEAGKVIMRETTVAADSLEALNAMVEATQEAAKTNLVGEAVAEQDFSSIGDNINSIMQTAATNAASTLKTEVDNITFDEKNITIKVHYEDENGNPISSDKETDAHVTEETTKEELKDSGIELRGNIIDSKDYSNVQKGISNMFEKLGSEVIFTDDLIDLNSQVADGFFSDGLVGLTNLDSAAEMINVAQHEYGHLLYQGFTDDSNWSNISTEIGELISNTIGTDALAQAESALAKEGYAPGQFQEELFANLLAGMDIGEVDLSQYSDLFLQNLNASSLIGDALTTLGEMYGKDFSKYESQIMNWLSTDSFTNAHATEPQTIEVESSEIQNLDLSKTIDEATQISEQFHIWKLDTGEAFANISNINAILTQLVSKATMAAAAFISMGGGSTGLMKSLGLSLSEVQEETGSTQISEEFANSLLSTVEVSPEINWDTFEEGVNDAGMLQGAIQAMMTTLDQLNQKVAATSFDGLDQYNNLASAWYGINQYDTGIAETLNSSSEAAEGLAPPIQSAASEMNKMGGNVDSLATGLATIIEQLWDIVAGAGMAAMAMQMLNIASGGNDTDNYENAAGKESLSKNDVLWNYNANSIQDDGGAVYSDSVREGMRLMQAQTLGQGAISDAISAGLFNNLTSTESISGAINAGLNAATLAIENGQKGSEAYDAAYQAIQNATNAINDNSDAVTQNTSSNEKETEINQNKERKAETRQTSEEQTKDQISVDNGQGLTAEATTFEGTINWVNGEVEEPPEVEADGTMNYQTGEVEKAESVEAEGTANYSVGDVVLPEPEASGVVNYTLGSLPIPHPVATGTINYELGSVATPAHGKAGAVGVSNIPGFATGKDNSIYSSKNWYGSGVESGHSAPRNYEGLAQVGEEGPELMVHDGQASLVGMNGPMYTIVHKDDTIFTNGQTKRLLGANFEQKVPGYKTGKNSKNIPGFATGTWSAAGAHGKGTGTSSKTDDDSFDFDFDWLYSILEDINELERKQVELEEKRNDILTDQSKTYKDLVSTTRQQFENLYKQQDMQTWVLERRNEEMQTFLDENKDMAKYASYNFEDKTIEADWEAIKALKTNKDEYDAFNDYLEDLEDIQSKIEDTEDAINDISNSIQDLLEEQEETYLDFEQKIYEGIVQLRQDEIDKLSDVSDQIQETNSNILDAANKAISQYRQDRDNQDTEDELSEKERRLAYLRQDTSGNNALEIKELEEELADARESYLDSLVDQKLETISDQEDYAAEQRERQIELMQAQLDWQEESGYFWQYAAEMFTQAYDEETGEFNWDSALGNLLKTIDNYEGMSELAQRNWDQEMSETTKDAMSYWTQAFTFGAEDYASSEIYGYTTIIDVLDDLGNTVETIAGFVEKETLTDENGEEYYNYYIRALDETGEKFDFEDEDLVWNHEKQNWEVQQSKANTTRVEEEQKKQTEESTKQAEAKISEVSGISYSNSSTNKQKQNAIDAWTEFYNNAADQEQIQNRLNSLDQYKETLNYTNNKNGYAHYIDSIYAQLENKLKYLQSNFSELLSNASNSTKELESSLEEIQAEARAAANGQYSDSYNYSYAYVTSQNTKENATDNTEIIKNDQSYDNSGQSYQYMGYERTMPTDEQTSTKTSVVSIIWNEIKSSWNDALSSLHIKTSATGGMIGAYASGSYGIHSPAGLSLTGEEGPELVWNKEKGYAYLTGENGAQMANLHSGDHIFNAKETEEIFKRPFLNIKDNSQSFMSNAAGTGASFGGDTTVTINIDATLGNDYDVEQLTEKIKKELYSAGAYRNVNVINRIR